MDSLLQQMTKDFPAAAEYLSNIYLIQRDYDTATISRLADWMGVSLPAVTQALGRLKKLGLVEQEKYGPMVLTPRGKELAHTVLRRHYLLEHLLVRILDYPWDKADEEAHGLQNQISDDFARHLDERLGYPQTCPHGNPLPGSTMEKKLLSAPSLDQAPVNTLVLILRITEEGEAIPEMLPTCQKEGIMPGLRVRVLENTDQGIRLSREGRPDFLLNLTLARHIRFEEVASKV